MNYSFLIKYMLSFLVVALVFPYTMLNAQLNIKGTPYSFSNELRSNVPVETMAPIDLVALQLEDRRDEANGLPYRFGYSFETNLNLNNSGVWTVLENGDRIWRLMIESSGANSINLTYDWFWLPEGAVFYIYSPDESEVLGGFTAQNNKGSKAEKKGFATSFIKTDQIILEYYEPAKEMGNGIISIDKIVHGYRTINNNGRLFGDSGGCNVNINCDEASDYQNEKRAVALVVINGDRWCSGALVTNTCENGAPFFLTADHCFGENNQDAISMPNDPTLMFLWNYESSSCSNGSDFTPPSTTGATMLSNAVPSDFALLFLTENPSELPEVDPFYLGWDRTGVTPDGGGVGIHHPRGDIKKFCEEEQSLSSTDYDSDTSDPDGDHWRVDNWNTGVTEGGSSGSPLMIRGTNRVVGQLHGGYAACDNNGDNDKPDWYGKFSVSWDNNGATDSRRRLRDWLGACSPNKEIMDGDDGIEACSSDLTLNGLIGYGGYNASNSITSAGIISASTLISYHAGNFIDLNPGFNTEAGADFDAQILPCPPGFIPDDNPSRSLGITPSERSINDKPNLHQLKVYPNPTSSGTTIEFTLAQLNTVEVTLVDVTGKVVQTLYSDRTLDSGTHQTMIDGSTLQSGVYFIYLKVENETPLIEKLIVN